MLTAIKAMGFIDGSNLLIEMSKEIDINFRADKPPWETIKIAKHLINPLFEHKISIRRHWFASYQGNDEYEMEYATKLRESGFEPWLFKKNNGKEKGVDIGLATEMLVNAFSQNYDIGIIVAGDKDYVQLVNEVKRFGPQIHGSFFCNDSLSDHLKIAMDKFTDIGRRVDILNHKHTKPLVEKIKEKTK